jgi:PAS domain S-box-containing protein
MMTWEARKIRKDGEMIWVRETANSVVLKKRPVLLVACENITEQKRAEDAARRSAKELRDVIDAVPVNIWSALPDGSIDFINHRTLETTGLSKDRALGWGWGSVVHSDDLPGFIDKWGAALASGKPLETELRVLHPDRIYQWYLVRGVPLRDELGKIVKWYGSSINIEDRKRAEALLAGEKRILEMVAKGDSLAQILDTLCRLVEEQASGVLTSVLLLDGNRLRHGAAPSLPKAYTEAIDGLEIGPSLGSCGTAAFRGEQVIVQDIATDPLWANYRAAALPHSLHACWSTPIFSADGKVIATFAMYYREPRSPSTQEQEIIEQITHLAGVAIERKQTQEALGRSEAYLAEAQRLTHTGSWAWDPVAEKTVYWSEEMFRIFAFDAQDGLPSAERFLERIHPEDRDKLNEVLRNAVLTKTEYAHDHRLVLPDGTVKNIHAIGHPILDSGEVLEFVGTSIDVTERKHAEAEREKLRQIEADLARINRVRMMGELTASLGHEIKQPIAAAVSNAEACLQWLARDQPNLAEVREAATETVKEARRAAEIITRVRSAFRKEEITRAVLDVNDVITETVSLVKEEADRRSIGLRTELDLQTPKISADRVQLQQVLINLMLNGIEAMNENHSARGELIIRSQRDEHGRAVISVTDAGMGLPAGGGEKIFDAFFTTKPQGTGMGLAISRSIIESHGGRLWAKANSGQGATFYFSLPNEAAEAA